MLLCHARIVLLSFAAMERAFCSTLIFPELAKLILIHAVPAVVRPRSPPISFCTVQLQSLCVACSLATLTFLCDLRFRLLKVFQILGLQGLLPYTQPSAESGNNNKSNIVVLQKEFTSRRSNHSQSYHCLFFNHAREFPMLSKQPIPY